MQLQQGCCIREQLPEAVQTVDSASQHLFTRGGFSQHIGRNSENLPNWRQAALSSVRAASALLDCNSPAQFTC